MEFWSRTAAPLVCSLAQTLLPSSECTHVARFKFVRLGDGLDYIDYQNLTALNKLIENIKKALDAGLLVRCGVLSGLQQVPERWETKNAGTSTEFKFYNPDHFILIFGYDENRFIFWDSDSTVSDIQKTGMGKGFGVLSFTGKTFSTGIDDADLANIDGNGDHKSLLKRHRYQVLSVQTLPVK
jgi:hypothetical protein